MYKCVCVYVYVYTPQVHCYPVEMDIYDQSRLNFKKAILESDSEW